MNETVDARIGALAARQHGVVSASQVAMLGASRAQVQHRIAVGRWERVVRGVYRIHGVPSSRRQRPMAAVLDRPDGAISFLSAAELAGLQIVGPPLPWLTVPSRSSGRTTSAHVRRSDLPLDQITLIEGIRVTVVARTLSDCSLVLGPNRLRKLVDEAMHHGLATPSAVDAVLDADRDPASIAAHDVLRDLVEVWRPAIRPGSPAEARFLRILGEWGFPPPQRQVKVRDRDGTVIARLDGGWPDRRIGYEYDSVEWHGPARWASDETRHELVQTLGWTLFHVDKSDITPGATRIRDRLVVAFVTTPTPRP